jgi:hypothetical protein
VASRPRALVNGIDIVLGARIEGTQHPTQNDRCSCAPHPRCVSSSTGCGCSAAAPLTGGLDKARRISAARASSALPRWAATAALPHRRTRGALRTHLTGRRSRPATRPTIKTIVAPQRGNNAVRRRVNRPVRREQLVRRHFRTSWMSPRGSEHCGRQNRAKLSSGRIRFGIGSAGAMACQRRGRFCGA